MGLSTMVQSGSIAVAGTAVKLIAQFTLTDSQLASIAGADISVQTNDILIRTDGGGALTTAGMLIKANSIARLTTRSDVLNCLMIQSSSAATVVVNLLKGD